MKYSDVRRLNLSDIAGEIREHIQERTLKSEEYEGYACLDRVSIARIEALCEELERRANEADIR